MKNKYKRHRDYGFFDQDIRLTKLSQLGDPLERLNKGVDFELFRAVLEDKMTIQSKNNAGGRPPYDYVLLFKILILQRYYNISDDQTEYQINDRMSFMRFLDLTISDDIPDSKTVWAFREKLSDLQLVESLFNIFLAELVKLGLALNEGKIVDASFIEVPRQRNTKQQNDQIKKGEIPADLNANSNVLSKSNIALFTATILVFSLISLNSCVSNYLITRTYTPLDSQNKTYPKSKNVELYFVGEQPKFEYEKLGIVQVKTTDLVEKTHLFSHLKYTAWQKGGDAIIGVNEDDKTTTYSRYFSRTSGNQTYTLFTPFIQGLAVKRIKRIDSLNNDAVEKIDTSFIEVVKSDQIKQDATKADADSGTALLTILIIAITVALILLLTTNHK